MLHNLLYPEVIVYAILVYIVIGLIWFFTTSGGEKEDFASIRVGANAYKVHEDLHNPKLAAETMDNLNKIAKTLIHKLNDKYINDPNGFNAIKSQHREVVINGIKRLTKNFRTANMEENIPERSGGDTSYVIDKGDVFAMCLRDPKNDNKVDDNINELSFVLIHEMAHLFTETFGHTPLFWTNFRFLLNEAGTLGLYNPINYKKNKIPYCGIVISYSPLYDNELQDYIHECS